MIFIRKVEQEDLNYDYSKDEKEIEKFLNKYGPKTLFQKVLKVINYFLYMFIFLIVFIKIGQLILMSSSSDQMMYKDIHTELEKSKQIKIDDKTLKEFEQNIKNLKQN